MEQGILARYGITERQIQVRKEYLNFTADDEQLLREIHTRLEPHAEEIIDRFYDHLLAHEHTRAFFKDEAMLRRLKAIQRQYFSELTLGQYGLSYVEGRLRIGEAHERVGLDPQWYLGAYNKYIVLVNDILMQELKDTPAKMAMSRSALTKIIMFDVGLAMDTYIGAAQRRLEVANTNLQGSNEELRRLQGVKQDLTNMVVHDLKNPLTSIMSLIQFLARKGGTAETFENQSLRAALRRCEDLMNMIQNLLQISRMESAQLDVEPSDVDLSMLVRESVVQYDQYARDEGKTLSCEPTSGVRVVTDKNLVRRILTNLIMNAIRHTRQGTRIRIWAEALPGGARVQVIDNGGGIPEYLKEHLFQKFGSPELRKAGYKTDTGLGLAFCQMAAKALGGDLRLDSREGEGTTAVLTLVSRSRDNAVAFFS